MAHVQSVRNRTCELERRLRQHEHDLGIKVTENESARLMPVMEILSAALYLAHPKLNRAQGVSVCIEMNVWYYADFVSFNIFIRQELNDNFSSYCMTLKYKRVLTPGDQKIPFPSSLKRSTPK
jgi:hypothetical protein